MNDETRPELVRSYVCRFDVDSKGEVNAGGIHYKVHWLDGTPETAERMESTALRTTKLIKDFYSRNRVHPTSVSVNLSPDDLILVTAKGPRNTNEVYVLNPGE